ncbi:helix-turn-helix transcriptional regulator [Pasteurellaceae bacterium LIM206]|nr:helix-turn-helix transcriptional regulator [Pasteurellaceae bacterium LIM206]
MQNLNYKIKTLRELNQLSQEQMAEKMQMSLNSYARLERGETKLSIEKLEQIAHIFHMDALEFMQSANKGIYFMLNDSADNNSVTYYSGDDKFAIENNFLKQIVEDKNNIIQQQKQEIEALKEIIALLKQKENN